MNTIDIDEKNAHILLDDFSARLGKRIQQLRWERGMTQESVAYQSGISVYTYQKFEKGESKPGTPMNPQLHTLLALAKTFDISVSDLLDLDQDV